MTKPLEDLELVLEKYTSKEVFKMQSAIVPVVKKFCADNSYDNCELENADFDGQYLVLKFSADGYDGGFGTNIITALRNKFRGDYDGISLSHKDNTFTLSFDLGDKLEGLSENDAAAHASIKQQIARLSASRDQMKANGRFTDEEQKRFSQKWAELHNKLSQFKTVKRSPDAQH